VRTAGLDRMAGRALRQDPAITVAGGSRKRGGWMVLITAAAGFRRAGQFLVVQWTCSKWWKVIRHAPFFARSTTCGQIFSNSPTSDLKAAFSASRRARSADSPDSQALVVICRLSLASSAP